MWFFCRSVFMNANFGCFSIDDASAFLLFILCLLYFCELSFDEGNFMRVCTQINSTENYLNLIPGWSCTIAKWYCAFETTTQNNRKLDIPFTNNNQNAKISGQEISVQNNRPATFYQSSGIVCFVLQWTLLEMNHLVVDKVWWENQSWISF